jgi:hypothetical protein
MNVAWMSAMRLSANGGTDSDRSSRPRFAIGVLDYSEAVGGVVLAEWRQLGTA